MGLTAKGTLIVVGLIILQVAHGQPAKPIEFDAANQLNHWAIEARLVGGVEFRGDSMIIAIDRCELFRPTKDLNPYHVTSIKAGITRKLDRVQWACSE